MKMKNILYSIFSAKAWKKCQKRWNQGKVDMALGYYNTVVTHRGIIHQTLEACIRAQPLKPREVYKRKLILGTSPTSRYGLGSFFKLLFRGPWDEQAHINT